MLTLEFKRITTKIKKFEETIVRVITKIRDGRTRPSYQNILTLVNRGNEFNESMELIKSILHEMIDNNDLLNGNKVQLYFIEMNSRFFISRATKEREI